ncbi:MAG: four helix bundle protein [Bacteroidetes bacterium]|nr:four helix bundle protein [Bacteroidota bacterium]
MERDHTNNGTFFRFEDLRVYHKALDYIDWVYNTTKLFPENASILAERFINSAQAIAFYIAEGSARNKSQFIYYLKMAKSSVRECVVITTLADKQGLLTDLLIDESRNELMEMTKMIGALIGSLQKPGRNKSRNNGKDDDFGNDYDDAVPQESMDIKKY